MDIESLAGIGDLLLRQSGRRGYFGIGKPMMPDHVRQPIAKFAEVFGCSIIGRFVIISAVRQPRCSRKSVLKSKAFKHFLTAATLIFMGYFLQTGFRNPSEQITLGSADLTSLAA